MKGETEFVLIMYTQLIIFEILKKIFIFFENILGVAGFFFQLSLIKSIEISSFLGITFSYDQNSILYGRFKEWLVLKMYNPVREPADKKIVGLISKKTKENTIEHFFAPAAR